MTVCFCAVMQQGSYPLYHLLLLMLPEFALFTMLLPGPWSIVSYKIKLGFAGQNKLNYAANDKYNTTINGTRGIFTFGL